VALPLDGSFCQDATALVAAEIGEMPHLDVAGLWEPPPGRPGYRVPILDVEETPSERCAGRWQVRQIVADALRGSAACRFSPPTDCRCWNSRSHRSV
jgi:hypothetical protein